MKLILIFFFIFFLTNKIYSSSFHFKQNSKTNFVHMDTVFFEIDKSIFLFNTYFLERNDVLKNKLAPVHIKKLNSSLKKIDFSYYVAQTEHVRHHKTIITPWGPTLLLADHGNDYPDLNKGGNIHAFVYSHKKNSFLNISQNFPQEKDFYFNIVTPKIKNHPYPQILLPTYNTSFSKVRLLNFNHGTYQDESAKLPTDWTSKNLCFMTGIEYDIELDGTDEVILGGCDLESPRKEHARDRVLKFKDNKWKLLNEEILPPRAGKEGWGTVYIQKADLISDAKNEIILLTHNKKITEAKIQILKYDNEKKLFKNVPITYPHGHKLPLSPYYFHKSIAYDFDKDGLLDIAVLVRHINTHNFKTPNVVFFKNLKNKFEYQGYNFLNLPEKYIVGIDSITSQNKKHIAFSYLDGSILILE